MEAISSVPVITRSLLVQCFGFYCTETNLFPNIKHFNGVSPSGVSGRGPVRYKMCRAPLTAHRSETFTILKKGHKAGRREGLVEGAGLKVHKGSQGGPCLGRTTQDFLEHLPLALRRAGGRAVIGRKHNQSPPMPNTEGSVIQSPSQASNIC